MKLSIAGGVGEHGRSCYFVEGNAGAFLVDCGIAAGESDPWPRLSNAQIEAARALFLTHVHKDHTGAIDWLIGRGFAGAIVATRETFAQLEMTPPGMRVLEDGGSPLSRLVIEWGRAGHCAGSVWYRFSDTSGSALLSGDYTEASSVYTCDPIRRKTADIAVLDAAYGKSSVAAQEAVRAFLDGVPTNAPALFPVPKHGRGPEMALLLRQKYPDIAVCGDAAFVRTVRTLSDKRDWIRPDCTAALRDMPIAPLVGIPTGPCFCFLMDAQLAKPSTHAFAEEFGRHGLVIVTGHADPGGGARVMLDAGSAQMSRFPVHQTLAEAEALAGRNTFAEAVYAHSPALRPSIMLL